MVFNVAQDYIEQKTVNNKYNPFDLVIKIVILLFISGLFITYIHYVYFHIKGRKGKKYQREKKGKDFDKISDIRVSGSYASTQISRSCNLFKVLETTIEAIILH